VKIEFYVKQGMHVFADHFRLSGLNILWLNFWLFQVRLSWKYKLNKKEK
jgi:hypothetical protein